MQIIVVASYEANRATALQFWNSEGNFSKSCNCYIGAFLEARVWRTAKITLYRLPDKLTNAEHPLHSIIGWGRKHPIQICHFDVFNMSFLVPLFCTPPPRLLSRHFTATLLSKYHSVAR